MAKGVSSLARRASGLISGTAKAVRSGLNLVQKTAKTVASAAARTVANISSMARRGYKAAKGFFSSFNSYVSYRTQQIKETIVRELCRNTGKVSTSQGKVNWNQASMKSIAGNTGVLMPTTASRISTAADAGVLVDTLANGWDDLLELLKAAGASLAGLITTIPAAPSLGLAIPASIVVVLLSPPIKAGESDEDIAEWKKQQEEEKKNQKPETTDEEKNSNSSKGNNNSGDKGNKKGVGGKGWRGDKTWRQNVDRVSEGGTIKDLNGQVPTQQEAIDLINEAGGTVN